ncbi:ABC transporter permease [Gulosibacter sp. 10]|uniref:ABC transporter permease n=1 Tax=Gulosibacter sp. 10 TaxID=1255570 RepID=UPI00097E7F40|nr:ABC transporter permease [Gulosibacter sp. 10]SJM71496.1 ABC transporter permease protein [Gulosibacter sp. 10]
MSHRAERPRRGPREPGTRATSLAAMLVDAWDELKVNRVRILLALVGITAAVVGLTGAVGAGTIMRDMMIETGERQSGRTATVSVRPSGEANDAQMTVLERLPQDYGVEHSTLIASGGGTALTPANRLQFGLSAVEPEYEALFRVPIVEGRFLVEEDADRLAPAVVVNEKLWEQLGTPDLRTDPQLTLMLGDHLQQAVIVGVSAVSSEWDAASAYALFSQRDLVLPQDSPPELQLSMWVPEDIADEFAMSLSDQLGQSMDMFASRDDWAKEGAAQLEVVQWAVAAAAGGMFLLGALGLVNINLVTMQHRVREIGIRRSYGATSGRIFLGVLLESVVATFVAGLVGVALTVLAVQNPLTQDWLKSIGVYEPSPFPLEAALIGLGASTLVGALAGALPAFRATRVQIVDAIRG